MSLTNPDTWAQIPTGWKRLPARTVCSEIVVGIVVKPAQYYRPYGVPVLRSANVREAGLDPRDLVFMSEDDNIKMSKSRVRVGDVLTVRTGYPGTSCVVPDSFNGSNCVDIIISRPNEIVLPSYLTRWLNSEFGKGQVLRRQGGLAQQHFNVGDLAQLVLVLPPIQEQARIAEVLDTLDEAIRGTEALVEKLLAAKQGLLMDTFEANVRSTAVPLGYYLQGIDAGKSPDCPEKHAQAGEWGVLKVSAVVRSGFRPNENKAVLNPAHFNAAYEVHPGDLLITRANTYDLIAQACVVRETPPHLMLCDKTLRLKPNHKASAEFLSIALTTPSARRHIEINATGSSGTMKNITQGAIRAIPVPNLDRAKQDQLTGQMAALVARIEAETEQMNKLKSLKSGLSADLLTGHVRVNPRASA